jgi:hypothetical protein
MRLFVAGQKNIGLKISSDKFSSLDFRPIRFFWAAVSADQVFLTRAFNQSSF